MLPLSTLCTPAVPRMLEPFVVLVGPTAVGKTALSLPIAQALGAEIVNVDSRQIYKHMDIGTAKPSLAQQAQVPHHLLDLCSPVNQRALRCNVGTVN